jgi:hypothetical protein
MTLWISVWNQQLFNLRATKLLDYSIKQIHKDRLYWDQYQYCATFQQTDISLLRGLSIEELQRNFRYRKQWGPYHRQKPVNETQILETFDFLSAAPGPIKLTFSWDYCYVYTNDLTWITTLPKQCAYITVFSVSKVVVDRPRDQVSLLNPTHQYRTWFREKAVPVEAKQRLANWVAAQSSEIKLSNSLTQWLNEEHLWSHHKTWVRRHFFIEHNSLQYETMLNMVIPGAIRKTQTVIQRTK